MSPTDAATAHSPGPWKYDDNHAVRDAAGRRIALTIGANGSEPLPEAANGRLLALAPEMFELLGRMVARHDGRSALSIYGLIDLDARALLSRVKEA